MGVSRKRVIKSSRAKCNRRPFMPLFVRNERFSEQIQAGVHSISGFPPAPLLTVITTFEDTYSRKLQPTAVCFFRSFGLHRENYYVPHRVYTCDVGITSRRRKSYIFSRAKRRETNDKHGSSWL